MKRFVWILIAVLGYFLMSCNDEVFVKEPVVIEPTPEPEPEPEPDVDDFLVLQSITYNESAIELAQDVVNSTYRVTYKFRGTGGDATILYDSYNSSRIKISSDTQFILPWAQLQPTISIPTLDDQLIPGFWGLEIPFEMGITVVPAQYLAGENETLSVPADSEVTATIYVSQRILTAPATIKYHLLNSTNISPEEANVTIEVLQPVQIRVVWSDIKPI